MLEVETTVAARVVKKCKVALKEAPKSQRLIFYTPTILASCQRNLDVTAVGIHEEQ